MDELSQTDKDFLAILDAAAGSEAPYNPEAALRKFGSDMGFPVGDAFKESGRLITLVALASTTVLVVGGYYALRTHRQARTPRV